ncbi:MAG: phosphate ABC transporter permease PstA [Marinilabiliales bacterium]
MNAKYNIKRKMRNWEEKFFYCLMMASVLLISFILITIIYSIVKKGLPSLSWEMISQTPKGGYYFGKEGGILNSIIGSIYLSLFAVILAFIVGFPATLFLNIHLAKRKRIASTIRFLLDLLWGVPSIVYGAFGFSIMVFFGLHTSLLAGIIIVALLILPIMIRSMDEVIKEVPRELTESALSLGSTNSEIGYKIMFRQCVPGIITAILLSLGRGIGDAASVLFTTGFTDNIPTSLTQPVATLPLSIFFQMSSPIEEVKNRAYASALILLLIILVISILSRLFSVKYEKNKVKG